MLRCCLELTVTGQNTCRTCSVEKEENNKTKIPENTNDVQDSYFCHCEQHVSRNQEENEKPEQKQGSVNCFLTISLQKSCMAP